MKPRTHFIEDYKVSAAQLQEMHQDFAFLINFLFLNNSFRIKIEFLLPMQAS
jgi:hypothetical protein